MQKKSYSISITELSYTIAIFLAALVLRLVSLDSLPYGFHNDEVMNGYVGRYIIEHGTDLYGNSWPILYFDNFGDYPNVIPMYLSGFSTWFLGMSEFAVRLPIAIAGAFAVAVVYRLCRWLIPERWVALLAAACLAILPWHLVLSRATAEGITATLVFVIGYWLYYRAVVERERTQLFLSVGVVLLFATYLLYPSFRIFAPLAVLPLAVWARGKSLRMVAIFITLALFLTTAAISQTTWGQGRFEQTSVFTHNDELAGRSLRYSTGLGPNQVLQARLFHNTKVLAVREIARQYLSYFSPEFLLGNAGKPNRYSVPEHGLLYFTVVAILVAAVLIQTLQPLPRQTMHTFFRQNRHIFFLQLLWLLAIAPLPAALTLDDVPNIHRTASMAIIWSILFAIAAKRVTQFNLLPHWKSVAQLTIILGLSLELVYFWHHYARLSGFHTTIHRSEEQRTAARWLSDHAGEYNQVFAPSNSALVIHYLFVQQHLDSNLTGSFERALHVDQVNNITFFPHTCPANLPEVTSAVTVADRILNRAECDTPPGFVLDTTLLYSDGTAAYDVLRLTPPSPTAITP